MKAAGPDWAAISLTPIEAGDLEKVNVWQNDPEIRDLIMGFRGPVRLETTADWIASLSAQNLKTRAVFAVRQDGHIKGVAQLHTLDWIQRTTLLGVYVGEAALRGAGMGRAATCLLLDFAFNGLDLCRVGLEAIASNNRACALYESLGFVREGVLRSAYQRAGRREDVVLFGLLRSEWTCVLPAEARRLTWAA